MDNDRLRWITRPPTLDRFEIGVRFAETPTGVTATYTAMGYCDRKRGALWVLSDTVPSGPDTADLGDHLWSLAQALATVRPVTEPSVQRALQGEYWEQNELPW